MIYLNSNLEQVPDKETCAGCGDEVDTENIDCDKYSQYWCEECGGVGQCRVCGHVIACQEMTFKDNSGEGTCEECD